VLRLLHNAVVVYADGRTVSRLWTPEGEKPLSTLQDVLSGNVIATASTMFPRGLIDEIPAWYMPLFPITDWPLHILHDERGPIGYIDEVMSAYRQHEGGLYTTKSEFEKVKTTVRFYRVMNRNLGFRHHALIKKACSRYLFEWAEAYVDRSDLRRALWCLIKCCVEARTVRSVRVSRMVKLARHMAAPRAAANLLRSRRTS
jgi:hypothetical protein